MRDRTHSGFTLSLTVKEGHIGPLRKLLQDLNAPTSGLDLQKSSTTLFVSGVILPSEDYFEEKLPTTLVFATTFCGPFKKHIYDVIRIAKKELIEILSHTMEFTATGSIGDETLYRFLNYHGGHSAFNSGNNCITKADITNEESLKSKIQDYLDEAQKTNVFNGLSSSQIKYLIERHIAARGAQFEWAQGSTRRNFYELWKPRRARTILMLCGIALLVILLAAWSGSVFLFAKYLPGVFPQQEYNSFSDTIRPPIILLGILLLILMSVLLRMWMYMIGKREYRRKIRNDSAAKRIKDYKLRVLSVTQLNPVINEMTAAGPLKKGLLRRFLYKWLLMIVNEFSLELPIQTVRSARWASVNRGRRLLFLSNFTNTTDFYVRDFLNGNTPLGINFMFSNGQGFPNVSLAVFGGVKKNPEGFIHAVHKGQQTTEVWYAHEKKLTVDIIRRNRKIRNGLFKKMSEVEAKQWLKLF